MATIFQTTNSIGPGIRVALADPSNTYTEIAGIAVVSTDASDAIQYSLASGNVKLLISGQLIGGNAIDVANINPSLALSNSAQGLIEGATGFGVLTTGNASVVNDGEIIGVSGAIKMASGAVTNTGTIRDQNNGGTIGVDVTSSGGTIENFGTITGGFASIRLGPNAQAGGAVYNYGTLNGPLRDQAAAFGTPPQTLLTDVILNAGLITGLIDIVGAKNLQFYNTGHIAGPLQLYNSGTVLFDSSTGSVGGDIYTFNSPSTVIGGTTGGTIRGGSGNDVLIANQGQLAADNAAHATLDGTGGTNALYGGGGYNTFQAGDSSGGYNQIWGGASKMVGVTGYANNSLSFALANQGVYVDLLNGHNAYVTNVINGNWSGSGTFEDSIVNVPNVVGSSYGDLIQADNGIDRLTGGGKADQLYAGSGGQSQDTFVYTAYGDSNTVTGYDTIVGFKLGIDKIDVAALASNGAHLAISVAGTSNTVYLEQTAGTFNANTDLALIVNTTAAGGLKVSDFVF